MLFDIALDRRLVDIAHDEDHRALGPVPGLIKRTQHFRRELLDGLGCADGRTLGDASAFQVEGEQLFCHARGWVRAQACFGLHHPSLAFQSRCAQRELACDFPQHRQSGLDRSRIAGWQVELVEGARDGRQRVGVGSALEAESLQLLPRFSVCQMPGAAKGHVLQHVRNASLGLALVERTGLEVEPEGHLSRGRRVVLKLIPQTVLKQTRPYCRVWRDVTYRGGSGSRR